MQLEIRTGTKYGLDIEGGGTWGRRGGGQKRERKGSYCSFPPELSSCFTVGMYSGVWVTGFPQGC